LQCWGANPRYLMHTRQALYHLATSLAHSFVCLFWGTGVWTQGLHLEPLCQPFFVKDFFKIGSSKPFSPGWLWTSILLIFASWVAKIAHEPLVPDSVLKEFI
jgi:hypothetical protein